MKNCFLDWRNEEIKIELTDNYLKKDLKLTITLHS